MSEAVEPESFARARAAARDGEPARQPDVGTLPTGQEDAAGGPLHWAAYLGASWTWVIGMFLPVLLIRDHGAAAWFVFAIPNVVGAAAMGWLIRSPDHSARFIANHLWATRWFGLVTIAFHLYFLLWMVPRLIGDGPATAAFAIAMLVLMPVLTTRIRHALIAMLVLGVSVAIAVMAAGQGSLGWPPPTSPTVPLHLVGLGAVCLLGFLTCPYLDLTFHRARLACATPRESRIAFGVGFGVAFHAMILFTLLYAGAMLFLMNGGDNRALGWLLGVHICVQAIFTVGIHASSLRATATERGGRGSVLEWMWVAVGVAIVAALVVRGLDARGLIVGGKTIGEVVYRLFMSYYGLIAPAYIWLCALPGRGLLPTHPSEQRAMWVAVVLAAPFYWLGFVHGPMTWVLIGVAIVLATKIFVKAGRRDRLAEQRLAMLARAGQH